MPWSDGTLVAQQSLNQASAQILVHCKVQWISEQTETSLVNRLLFEPSAGTANRRPCALINLKHADNFLPSPFLRISYIK